MLRLLWDAGWSSPVARQAHNLKVVGSNPAPATNFLRLDYFVYIIENAVGRKYIGLTENILVRLQDQNSGISTWTRARGPWRLNWQQGPMSLSDARKLENLLKQQKGGGGLYRLTGLARRP